jgi:hypothetical protein
MENVGMIYGYSEFSSAIWYIVWPLGNLVVVRYTFPRFWYIVSRKIWQPWFLYRFCLVSTGHRDGCES